MSSSIGNEAKVKNRTGFVFLSILLAGCSPDGQGGGAESDGGKDVYTDSDNYTISVIDVEVGDALLIETGAGQFVLIDSGDVSQDHPVMDYLSSRGVGTIYRAIISHPDKDHYGDFASIVDQFTIEGFIHSGYECTHGMCQTMYDRLEDSEVPIYEMKDGDGFSVDNLTFKVLFPLASGELLSGADNNSLCIVISNESGTDFFTGGDIGPDAIDLLLDRHGDVVDVELAKANHHGMPTDNPSVFYDATTPTDVFVTDTEANGVEAPTVAETKDMLAGKGIKAYNTVVYGDIVVSVKGADYTIATEYAP